MTKPIAALRVFGVAGAIALIPWAASAADPTIIKPLPPKTAEGTIGLALTSWRYALYETEYAKEECPDGLQPGERVQWKATPNFDAHVAKIGGNYQIRGPNGETGDNNPMAVEDQVPFREYKATKTYGVNLDGTQDGAATAKTCKHAKFTNPEGEKVDNQIQRVIGCVQGWRTGGQMAEYQADEFVTSNVNRTLIEITGVDNEQNDPSVDVTVYKGTDRLLRASGENKFVPYTPQRIDERFPKYTMRTKGKIVEGVLITDPIPDARLSAIQETNAGDRVMKDLVLRLKLTEDGGEGFVAGYENTETWFITHAKKSVSDVGLYSSASLYRALQKYADSTPDATGHCGYISTQFKVRAQRATIVHQQHKPKPTVQNESDVRVASVQK